MNRKRIAMVAGSGKSPFHFFGWVAIKIAFVEVKYKNQNGNKLQGVEN